MAIIRFPDRISFSGFCPGEIVITAIKSTAAVILSSKQQALSCMELFCRSLMSIIPWAATSREKFPMPTTINKQLRRRARSSGIDASTGQPPRLRFRPYVGKVPWHTGVRAFLSQLFPRYGRYCGPNWSSGKDGGSLIWDKRPIDWLDFCCYCHDMGYDTHDQAKLLEADLAFLECLEKPGMKTKGDVHAAYLYKNMCIQGLRNILIPYRMHLVKLRTGQPLLSFGWISNIRWNWWQIQPSLKAE